jgi:hypothetical protein
MFAVAHGIARKEGMRALWSGVGPACIRVGGGAGAPGHAHAPSALRSAAL